MITKPCFSTFTIDSFSWLVKHIKVQLKIIPTCKNVVFDAPAPWLNFYSSGFHKVQKSDLGLSQNIPFSFGSQKSFEFFVLGSFHLWATKFVLCFSL